MAGTHAANRVGPNAVIQLALAVRRAHGRPSEEALLQTSGLSCYVDHLPEEMIDEQEAAELFRRLFASYRPEEAAELADIAGTETAEYILAHRIPKAAQRLLRVLPAPLAARGLLSAIARHAWTFAGSGEVTTAYGHPTRLTIRANPLAMPGCIWHVAVFTRLFRALVHPSTTVRQTACCCTGSPACVFEIETAPRAMSRVDGEEAVTSAPYPLA